MRLRTRPTRALPLLLPVAWAAAGIPGSISGQDRSRCAPVERFLTEELEMVVVAEADSVDDWRTGRVLPGCRVTAAGTTARDLPEAAAAFYGRLERAGWRRTPDPADSPGEASLRLRLASTDCLFNVYSGVLLGTEAELEVSAEAVPGAGETRLNVLVLCVAARRARQPPPSSSGLALFPRSLEKAGKVPCTGVYRRVAPPGNRGLTFA